MKMKIQKKHIKMKMKIKKKIQKKHIKMKISIYIILFKFILSKYNNFFFFCSKMNSLKLKEKKKDLKVDIIKV
jgi:hypothetical protein